MLLYALTVPLASAIIVQIRINALSAKTPERIVQATMQHRLQYYNISVAEGAVIQSTFCIKRRELLT